MITCFIRYEIDPFRPEAFAEYARNWGQAIPPMRGRFRWLFWPARGFGHDGIRGLSRREPRGL